MINTAYPHQQLKLQLGTGTSRSNSPWLGSAQQADFCADFADDKFTTHYYPSHRENCNYRILT